MSTPTNDPRARYLQHRAVLHETLSRMTATLACNPLFSSSTHPCRLRKCRRDGVCCGPMMPCSRLQERIRMLNEVGLSSTAGTTLPLCMISADDGIFEILDSRKAECAKVLAEYPQLTWADVVFRLRARIRLRRRPTAPAPPHAAVKL